MQAELKLYKKFIVIFIGIVVAISIYLIIDNVKLIKVSGDSMNVTLRNGQFVIIQKYPQNINRNDIIVFDNDGLAIKRVIGFPQDQVKLCDNSIFINGVKINPYTYDGENLEYNLKDYEYFVIGDNYNNSYDSRDYGPINENVIIGKVIFIL